MTLYPASTVTRSYSNEFREEVLQQLEQGRSLAEVSRLMSVSPTTIYKWNRKNQSQQVGSRRKNIRLPQPIPKALNEQALDTLNESQNPIGELTKKSVKKNSKGRPSRYEDEFKQRALAKLDQQISPLKIAKLMGISVQTLYAWRKQAQQINQLDALTSQIAPNTLTKATGAQLLDTIQDNLLGQPLTHLPNVWLEEGPFDEAAELLKTIAHPIRMRVILLLAHRSSLNVKSIQRALKVNRSQLTPHLIKLRDRGILFSVRHQNQRHYYLTDWALTRHPLLQQVLGLL
jgi:transposase-like protein/DNA-binding transcriptional ArsR family regulator